MSTTKVDVTIRLAGREVFASDEAPAATNEQQRTLNLGNTALSDSHSPTTTPRVDKPPLSLKVTLGASPSTLDLTAIFGLALPPGATRTLDMTGAKLVNVLLAAPSTNAAVVNVAPGASNPYPLFGAGNDIDLAPGRTLAAAFSGIASSLPAVSGTVKTITISGTAADVLNLDLYFGT